MTPALVCDKILADAERKARRQSGREEKEEKPMKYTSSEANKLLRKLNEEMVSLCSMEEKISTFRAIVGEDPESVRPEYDYRAVQEALDELDRKIRVVKHAVNQFNLEHVVPGFDMTVDQMLVYIPQLSLRKRKLSGMARRLPKERQDCIYSGRNAAPVVEYTYANYDVKAAKADLDAVSDELARAQTALDVLNNTELIETDL